MSAYLRAGYAAQADEDFERRLAKIKNAPILALDDLGAEAGQNVPFEVSWAQDKVYQLLDHRLVEQLPTIVTTNLPFNKLPQRIASRLQDRHAARVIAITTDDKRTLRSGRTTWAKEESIYSQSLEAVLFVTILPYRFAATDAL